MNAYTTVHIVFFCYKVYDWFLKLIAQK